MLRGHPLAQVHAGSLHGFRLQLGDMRSGEGGGKEIDRNQKTECGRQKI